MSFFEILDTILLGPLKLVFEIIFSIANRVIGHAGLAIIVLSLVMNILVLPLYRRADAMQEEARDVDAKLRDGVAHIKKTFSGDERMMILQTYYRQNNYSPLSALKGSVSLLLEIPFFMAAYQFLSHLDILNGVSLGPITDLGKPDGLITIGSITLNLLPILMTLINFISSYLYLKGFPLKTKIQLYGMALFFLFFLYTSPACLVFYWTLNNLFSLVKTIFYKIKNPKKVLEIITFILGLGFIIFSLFFYNQPHIRRKVLIFAVGVILLCPAIISVLSKRIHLNLREPKPNKKMFVLGALFLTALIGLLIPSNFIAASPQEYVDITNFHNPIWYIVSSTSLAVGTFLVWFGVFYWLASPRGKEIFDKLIWVACGIMLVDYMLFGTNLGIISSSLQYENDMRFSIKEQAVNILTIFLLSAVMYFIATKWRRVAVSIILTVSIALCGMSVPNIVTISKSISSLNVEELSKKDQNIHLSKNGKNVMVIMLDRAMGEYIPFLFEENPELKKQFEGFTYYSNVISHGGFTNFGVPTLLGGYEYTPVEMNRRDDEFLVDKHNEALKVLPVTFLKENFEVTVCDPPYANYQWIPDLSIYDEYSEIRSFITEGRYGEFGQKKQLVENSMRNFFCFSLMKSLPLIMQPTLYNSGKYNKVSSSATVSYTSPQEAKGLTVATGVDSTFLSGYSTLAVLKDITTVKKDDKNTFLFISNTATHHPQLMQLPDYKLSQNVDNREYTSDNDKEIVVNGKKLKMETIEQVAHYHVNMATLIQMGNWFDYMRENGVFDNTRIILASDHGRDTFQSDELKLDYGYTAEMYFPLLMVKDFESKEFTTSDKFMTTADVPFLAVNGIIENPKNPFTDKPISMEEKTAHDQMIILSGDWNVLRNNGKTFVPSKWASVKDDIWNTSNWNVYNQDIVLKENKLP